LAYQSVIGCAADHLPRPPRHTHASQLIASGIDVVRIAKRLGHASPNITLSTYAYLFAVDDRTAAAAIDAAVKG